MMFKVLFFLGFTTLVNSQSLLVASRVDYADNAAPTPYQFSYTAPAIGGSSSRQETGDGNGRVTGSYTVDDDDGRSRIVEYVADENGFRAAISTNEPGTANQNPADVTIATSADDGFGGEERFNTPAVAVAAVPVAPAVPVVPATPVIPAAPVAPARLSPRPVAVPRPRPALIPIQPAPIPIQPALVPIQPALVPIEPNIVPRRFITQPPALFPLDAGQFIPGPAFLPFEDRRVIAPPALIPIDNPRIIPDSFIARNIFRPLHREVIV